MVGDFIISQRAKVGKRTLDTNGAFNSIFLHYSTQCLDKIFECVDRNSAFSLQMIQVLSRSNVHIGVHSHDRCKQPLVHIC